MANKETNPGADPMGSPAPKRPHATLDLKATEIRTPLPAPAASYAEAKTSEASAKSGFKTSSAAPGSPDAPRPAAATKASPDAASFGKSRVTGRALGLIAAGIVGGTLALAAAKWALPQSDDPGAASRLADASLSQRIGALEKSISSDAMASSDVTSRLAKLEDSIAVIPALKEAQARLIADTKAALAAAASDAGEPEQLTRLGALEDKFKALLDAGADEPASGKTPQLAALTIKVAELENKLAAQLSEAATSGTQRIDRDVAAVKADAARIEERVQAMKAELDRAAAAVKLAQEDAGAFRAELGAVKAATAKPADVAAAIAPLSERLAALDLAVQNLSRAEESRRADGDRIVLSLELQDLKRALDSGRGYADELAAVAKAAQGNIDLAALDKFKESGVPTLANLSKEFRAAAHAAIDAEAEPVGGGVVDRLIAGAKSVVRVRKVDHPPDDKSTEAIVGRMEAALNAGRLEDFLAQAKDLPPKAQDAARPFLDKLAARVAVDAGAGQTQLSTESLAPRGRRSPLRHSSLEFAP